MAINTEEVYDAILNGDSIELRQRDNENQSDKKPLKKFNDLVVDITEEKLEELSQSENPESIFLMYGYLLKNNLTDNIRKKKFKILRENNFYTLIKLHLLLQKYKDGDIEKEKIYKFIEGNHTQLSEFKEIRDFIKDLSEWSEK